MTMALRAHTVHCGHSQQIGLQVASNLPGDWAYLFILRCDRHCYWTWI